MRGQQVRIHLALVTTCAIVATMPTAVLTAGDPKEAKIACAVRAPPAIGKDATIMDVDGTVLRPGSNS